MRFFVKKKGFQILNIPSLGARDVLVIPVKEQIDLIDMRHLPHGNNKWILHCVDHWSKFNFAYALDAKTASNVAEEDANTDVEQDAQCSMSSSHQGSATQNVVNEAEEDTLHAEVSAAESDTIEREIRIKADRKYLSSAKKMAERYNKQHSTLSFVIGESVSVRIPRIDRASSDLSRLPCVVVDIVGGDQSLYRLRCQHGVLNVCYTAGELEKFNGSVVCTEENWQNQRFISLREAARKQAPWNHFVSNACKCKTGCLNRKCQCVRKNISCSTYCHKSASCSNCPSCVTGSSIEVVPTACHEDFDPWSKFCADVGGCYFQCGPLQQYWNMHMRPISASVVSLFAGEYLYLHYSEVDDLCEWVLNAREAFEKHTQSAEYPFEHPVESESEEKGIITKRKCCSRTPKLWMTCGELKLYEADRVVLESNQSWLNDNIINAAQTLLKTKYGTPGLQNTLLTTALQGCVSVAFWWKPLAYRIYHRLSLLDRQHL
eukprot:Em0001g988a